MFKVFILFITIASMFTVHASHKDEINALKKELRDKYNMRPSSALFQDITESYLGLIPESENLVMFEKVGKHKYIKWVGTIKEEKNTNTPQVNNTNVDNNDNTSNVDNENKVNSEIQLVPITGVDEDPQSSYGVVSLSDSISSD